jgi:tetratricopeptide (TPR) repeat protein
MSRRGGAEDAIRQWRKALEVDPKYGPAHAGLGETLYAQGSFSEALAHWREAIELEPNDAVTLRRLAWALTSCPDATLRSGSEAVALAVRALQLTGGKDAAVLDTLAAAYARKEQYADAVSTARRALALAAARDPQLAEAIRRRLAEYEAKARP